MYVFFFERLSEIFIWVLFDLEINDVLKLFFYKAFLIVIGIKIKFNN